MMRAVLLVLGLAGLVGGCAILYVCFAFVVNLGGLERTGLIGFFPIVGAALAGLIFLAGAVFLTGAFVLESLRMNRDELRRIAAAVGRTSP